MPQQIFNVVYLLLCGASGPPAVVATVCLAAYGQTQLNFKFLGGPDNALQVDDVSLFLQFPDAVLLDLSCCLKLFS